MVQRRNPLKHILCTPHFRFCSLSQVRGRRSLCLPKDLVARLNLEQVALPLPVIPSCVSVLTLLGVFVRHCRLDCTFQTFVSASLRPGQEKVLPSLPLPFCHLSPLPPIPTIPPAPSFFLPPVQNPSNFSSAPALNCFLLFGLGFKTNGLPVGLWHG